MPRWGWDGLEKAREQQLRGTSRGLITIVEAASLAVVAARADLDLARRGRAHRRPRCGRGLRRRRDGAAQPARPARPATGCARAITRRRQRRGGRDDRAQRRRRVRAQPGGGRLDAPQPRRVRGRAADRAQGRRRRRADPGRAAVRAHERPRAVAAELARAALDCARAQPAADRRPQRLPGARRRHGHEHDAHRARGRRRARTLERRPTAPRS